MDLTHLLFTGTITALGVFLSVYGPILLFRPDLVQKTTRWLPSVWTRHNAALSKQLLRIIGLFATLFGLDIFGAGLCLLFPTGPIAACAESLRFPLHFLWRNLPHFNPAALSLPPIHGSQPIYLPMLLGGTAVVVGGLVMILSPERAATMFKLDTYAVGAARSPEVQKLQLRAGGCFFLVFGIPAILSGLGIWSH